MLHAVADPTVFHIELFKSGSEPERASAVLVLVAFLVTFAFIRTSARLMRSPKVPWWPGSVTTESGLHIHHLVWGIWLMIISGFLAFATDLQTPWWQVISIAFGIGVGLTLDEFALWLHLDDVYWSEQGRSSVDAAILAAVLGLLVVLGLRPFGLDETASVVGTIVVATVHLTLVAITFFKGRIFLGALALFVPVVGLWCACRLAKPGSPWAHKRYTGKRAGKMERAEQRWNPGKTSAEVGRKLQDFIGGVPTSELEAEGEAPSAAAADAGHSEPEPSGSAAVDPAPRGSGDSLPPAAT
ncbi:MAG: hypothetical protein U0R70_15490 [Solirubrobacteraceae bacterium]